MYVYVNICIYVHIQLSIYIPIYISVYIFTSFCYVTNKLTHPHTHYIEVGDENVSVFNQSQAEPGGDENGSKSKNFFASFRYVCIYVYVFIYVYVCVYIL